MEESLGKPSFSILRRFESES